MAGEVRDVSGTPQFPNLSDSVKNENLSSSKDDTTAHSVAISSFRDSQHESASPIAEKRFSASSEPPDDELPLPEAADADEETRMEVEARIDKEFKLAKRGAKVFTRDEMKLAEATFSKDSVEADDPFPEAPPTPYIDVSNAKLSKPKSDDSKSRRTTIKIADVFKKGINTLFH